MKSHGTPFNLSQQVTVYDFKNEASKILKPPGSWHFKFNPSKRFFLFRGTTNVYVQGEEHYRSEMNDKKLVTKKKSVTEIDPIPIPTAKNLKEEKIRDVTRLLSKHYGENWKDLEDLKFYTEISNCTPDDSARINDIQCEPIEENYDFV